MVSGTVDFSRALQLLELMKGPDATVEKPTQSEDEWDWDYLMGMWW